MKWNRRQILHQMMMAGAAATLPAPKLFALAGKSPEIGQTFKILWA